MYCYFYCKECLGESHVHETICPSPSTIQPAWRNLPLPFHSLEMFCLRNSCIFIRPRVTKQYISVKNFLSSHYVKNWCFAMNVWVRVWHLYRFWHERISEYIRVKKMTRTNIRIYSYEFFGTNEYPNIFVSKSWYERISE